MEQCQNYAQDQAEHATILRNLVLNFCTRLLQDANSHDNSKFSEKEFQGFVGMSRSLADAKTGFDTEYQKNLKTEAIQNHVHNNKHHPEYWTSRNQEMPLEYAIIMFFDWSSRSKQKGMSVENFWEYNIAKLEKQPKALAVVELLKTYIQNYL